MTTLAIVDDHEALRDGLALVLGAEGLEVVGGAGSVAAARALLADRLPDVVLVDIRLPDGSGIDLARDLLADRKELGIVLYTGHEDATLLYDGLDTGARGFLLKAGSTQELVAAIERVAGGGSYVDRRLDRVLLSPRATAHVPSLSPREREIMHLMAEGATAEGVATQLGVSVETVRTHVRNAIRRLQARNRVHAIAVALERGEIALDGPAVRRGEG